MGPSLAGHQDLWYNCHPSTPTIRTDKEGPPQEASGSTHGLDQVAPRPKRRHRPRGTTEVTVDIHVDTPNKAVHPPCAQSSQGDGPDSSEEPLSFNSADPMELETEASDSEHCHFQIGSPPTSWFHQMYIMTSPPLDKSEPHVRLPRNKMRLSAA